MQMRLISIYFATIVSMYAYVCCVTKFIVYQNGVKERQPHRIILDYKNHWISLLQTVLILQRCNLYD